jgi:hypothetical protein
MSADPAQRPISCREFLEDLTGQTWQGWSTAPKGDFALDSGVFSVDSKTGIPGVGDLWYLIYKNPDGENQKVKGSTESIRQNVKAGLLGDSGSILVCRTKQGSFTPLKAAPEFRDLVVAPATIEAGKLSGKFSAAGDTARAVATVPQTKSGAVKKRTKNDPAANVETELHNVKPLKPRTEPRIPVKATPKRKSFDYMPWLILAITVAAATVGIIFFSGRH